MLRRALMFPEKIYYSTKNMSFPKKMSLKGSNCRCPQKSCPKLNV